MNQELLYKRLKELFSINQGANLTGYLNQNQALVGDLCHDWIITEKSSIDFIPNEDGLQWDKSPSICEEEIKGKSYMAVRYLTSFKVSGKLAFYKRPGEKVAEINCNLEFKVDSVGREELGQDDVFCSIHSTILNKAYPANVVTVTALA